MKLTESTVEDAALDWFRGPGYEVLSGLVIAPGEPAAERADYKQVFLSDRLQTNLEDLNPEIPVRDALLSGELRVAEVGEVVHNRERRTV